MLVSDALWGRGAGSYLGSELMEWECEILELAANVSWRGARSAFSF